MAASKHIYIYIYTHMRNAIVLVWGLFRLVSITHGETKVKTLVYVAVITVHEWTKACGLQIHTYEQYLNFCYNSHLRT